jgi:tryptophan-rich sensory protein
MQAATAEREAKAGKRKAQGEARRPPFVVAFIAVYVLVAGSRLAHKTNAAWFDSLRKPPWAMPSTAQTVAWMVMLGLLAYSTVVMFRSHTGTKTSHAVLALRVVHLVLLNLLVFLLFATHALAGAAIVATLLFATAVAIVLTAQDRAPHVAIAMGVYSAWLLYDAGVSWALWVMNR